MSKKFAVLRLLRQIAINPFDGKKYLDEKIEVMSVWDSYDKAEKVRKTYIYIDGQHFEGDQFYKFEVIELTNLEYQGFLNHKGDGLFHLLDKYELYNST